MSETDSRPTARAAFERRLLAGILLAGLPGTAAALVLLGLAGWAPPLRWGAAALMLALWLGAAWRLRGRLVRRLGTLANALGALREGDFSIRVREQGRRDALGELVREVNALGETLRRQRGSAVEAHALLRVVLAEVDLALFAFDDAERLRLTNRAGERLLDRSPAALAGRTAAELGLADLLAGKGQRLVELRLPGGAGRWALRRTTFREEGRPYRLLVLADLNRALREEERAAWQRLVRVLGHELNNTLAPVGSLAASLRRIVGREPLPDDWRQDVDDGLGIIAARTESLRRFLDGYAKLARLPQPRPAPLDLAAAVRRAAALETRHPVAIEPGPDLTVRADGDQLEQVLINLLQNAVEAARPGGGRVAVGWRADGGRVEIRVTDEGPGLASDANLFVPFFTTKPDGSGIGLVLSRQIAEAHGGTLDLANRADGPGCVAVLRLPL
mgnify:FL=1